jgi:diguanylate cyclase (GGDEF)-like protein
MIARRDLPLIRRLLWQDPVRSGTLISEDRGLMARTFGTLYLVAAALGAISLLAGNEGDRSDLGLALVSVLALLFGVVCFQVYTRMPTWAFQVATAGGSLMIAAATATGSQGAEGGYGIFYIWVVLLAFLFFRFRPALVQMVFAVGSYAVVLAARDVPFAFNYTLGLIAVLGAAGAVVALLRQRMERLATNLASEAHTDALTGVANRRGFDARFELELGRAARDDRTLSLIICDLDRFKEVNDELGHGEGDDALRRTAARIAASVRSIDAVSRIGGEEFAVLLPRATRMEAYVVAERIRTGLLDEFASYTVPLTASCGVASQDRELDGQELLRDADLAMYRAKRAGRNCTVVAGTDEPERPGEPGEPEAPEEPGADYSVAESSTK